MLNEVHIVMVHFSGEGDAMRIRLQGQGQRSLPAEMWYPSLPFHQQAQRMIASQDRIPRLTPLRPQIRMGNNQRVLLVPFLTWSSVVDPSTAWMELGALDSLIAPHGAILLDGLSRFWTAMPGGDRGWSGLQAYGGQLNAGDRAVFFGGTFHPWHEGHTACVKAHSGNGQLVVVPDRNPFKSMVHHQCAWSHFRSIADRLKDTEGLVYPGFLSIEHPNPTAHWMAATNLDFRGLIMGDDSFQKLTEWIDYKTLVGILDTLIIVPRAGDAQRIEQVTRQLGQLNPNLSIHRAAHHPYETLSSTVLRGQTSGHSPDDG